MARPTDEAVFSAVNTMAEVIPFFPASPVARKIVFDAIRDFCGDKRGLEWLAGTACRVMKAFSIAELRALYCTRYPPCDGLPATACDIPGFTPAEAMDEAEMRYLLRESEETDRKLLAWKAERAKMILSGEPRAAPLQITGMVEAACEMPQLPEKPSPRFTPAWLRDLYSPAGGAKEELDLRPLRQVEEEVAQLPKPPQRTPEEARRLIDEIQRAILQRMEAGSVQ